MKKTEAGLNIKAVAERTGVPLHTLRAWERRYGVPQPARVPGNHYRVYDEQDIADVIWIKRQVEAGVSPAQASALLQQQARRSGLPAAPEQPIATTRAALLKALLASDEPTAQQLLDEAWALFSPEQVARALIQPIMQEIGRKWMNDELSIGQEHFATNLIRQRLLAVLQAQPTLPLTAPRLVAACPPAEQHELGLLLLALLARRNGWQVYYLGQCTPLADLVRWSRLTRLIVLSVSTATGLASLIPLWLEGRRPPAALVFGGVLFNQLPQLREHIPGAFLGYDAVEAVRALATSDGRVTGWRPPADLLRAAVKLQEQRLRLAETTLGQVERRRQGDGSAHYSLIDATLFLVDALASALAFDCPEVMDAQGRWLRTLLTSRGVERQALEEHLRGLAHAAQRWLPDESKFVAPLLQRLAAAANREP